MIEFDIDTILITFKSIYDSVEILSSCFKTQSQRIDFFGKAAKDYSEKIYALYNNIKILGMTKPIPLDSLFINVNILEKITSRQSNSLMDLEKSFLFGERGFGKKLETISGKELVEKVNYIMLLGKPGAGKTTFLKYIATQSIKKNKVNQRIPIYISLKSFSEKSYTLMEYIIKQFEICNFPKDEIFIKQLLLQGKCFLLFDGLDEVNKDDTSRVINDINDIVSKYSKNQFIISCRIAAYNYCFQKFTDVEMADFNKEQIEKFIGNWFHDSQMKKVLCINKLFQKENKPIIELAKSPLLLTLLCITFDDNIDFPLNRAELYQDAIDALLRKWDTSRNIVRDEIYKGFSIKRKMHLLSIIATKTFEESKYFIKKDILSDIITDYLKNLSHESSLGHEIDGNKILNSIEAQHGILVERAKNTYSFSHLTFHEFFVAMYIKNEHQSKMLIENHLYDLRWREVILLTANILEEADSFLINISEKINDDFGINSDTEISSFAKYLIDTHPKLLIDMSQYEYCINLIYRCLDHSVNTILSIENKFYQILQICKTIRNNKISLSLDTDWNNEQFPEEIEGPYEYDFIDLKTIRSAIKDIFNINEKFLNIGIMNNLDNYSYVTKKIDSYREIYDLILSIGSVIQEAEIDYIESCINKKIEEIDIIKAYRFSEIDKITNIKNLYERVAHEEYNKSSMLLKYDEIELPLNIIELLILGNFNEKTKFSHQWESFLNSIEIFLICFNSEIYVQKNVKNEILKNIFAIDNSQKEATIESL